MRNGVRLAFDWGKARIGVAACDAGGLLAYPVETVSVGGQSEARLLALVREYEPLEIIVGLPRTLAGGEGLAAVTIRGAATAFAAHVPGIPVRLVDERLTTVAASRRLSQAGRGGRRQRAVIDQAAAVAILEQALEYERTTGRPPGEPLTGHDGPEEGRSR